MWGTDMTTTALGTGKLSRRLRGQKTISRLPAWIKHVAERGTRFETLQPIRQGVQERFGAIGEGRADRLTLRHDNGSQSVSHAFL